MLLLCCCFHTSSSLSYFKVESCRSRWPCGLTRKSVSALLLGSGGSNSVGGMDVYLLCLLCDGWLEAPAMGRLLI
jgi:hypothetical protein